jgi:hypothetical protein
LHRPADLIGDGAQPIFKTVVIAHPYMLAGVQRDPRFAKNIGIRGRGIAPRVVSACAVCGRQPETRPRLPWAHQALRAKPRSTVSGRGVVRG